MSRVALVAAISLLPLSAAHADEFPARKPGLWEITMSPERSAPTVTKFCIDAATDAELRDMGHTAADSACTRRDVHRDGDTLTADTVCKFGPSVQTTHSVTTFAGGSAYKTVTTSHFDPPRANGRADSAMTQDAKWLGPCGPDMKPGDVITPMGKMNLRKQPTDAAH